MLFYRLVQCVANTHTHTKFDLYFFLHSTGVHVHCKMLRECIHITYWTWKKSKQMHIHTKHWNIEHNFIYFTSGTKITQNNFIYEHVQLFARLFSLLAQVLLLLFFVFLEFIIFGLMWVLCYLIFITGKCKFKLIYSQLEMKLRHTNCANKNPIKL